MPMKHWILWSDLTLQCSWEPWIWRVHPLCCTIWHSVIWWTHWHPAISSIFRVSLEPHKLPNLLHIVAFEITKCHNPHKSQLEIWTHFVPSTCKRPPELLISGRLNERLSCWHKQTASFPLEPKQTFKKCNHAILARLCPVYTKLGHPLTIQVGRWHPLVGVSSPWINTNSHHGPEVSDTKYHPIPIRWT